MEAITPFLAFDTLFPRGIWLYLVGGLLIGLGLTVIYVATGIITGASTFLESTLSYVSTAPRFNRPAYVQSRARLLASTAVLAIVSPLLAFVLNPAPWTTDVQWWRLLGGGILVGIGTRLGKGCTSGHGVCGVGSLSRTSLVNVVTFLAIAVGTAQLVQAVGISP
jgi:uncharacterized membrane protein YedE/YeeE